jgi:hypothetical protein
LRRATPPSAHPAFATIDLCVWPRIVAAFARMRSPHARRSSSSRVPDVRESGSLAIAATEVVARVAVLGPPASGEPLSRERERWGGRGSALKYSGRVWTL